jgi:hypothetical protein
MIPRAEASGPVSRSSHAKGVFLGLASLFVAGAARAEPGTHGPAISTWDTRASSVVVGFRPGFLDGGHFDIFSYNANFTATNGKLSSQFGLHYLNLRHDSGLAVMHGVGATATALFNIPTTDRFDDGTPKFAVGLYIGAAPSALLNERSSNMSIPFPVGIGLPWAPAKAVYIAPWFEASPGVHLDTRIRDSTLPIDPALFTTNGTSVTISDAAVKQILDSSVDYHVTGSVGFRAGLDIGVRLGPSVDLNLNGMMGSLGGAFGGKFVGWVGGGFAFRWDNVVAAVLPPGKRLLDVDCADIDTRYRSCHETQAPAMTPVSPAANPPSTRPAYPPPAATPAPPSVPAAAFPAPAPAYQAPAPGAAPPPASSPAPGGAAPAGSAVPTTSFPQ